MERAKKGAASADVCVRRSICMGQIIDIYRDLLDEPDIAHSICKYIANSNCGLDYDFGSTVIPKGTKLYRIRTYNPDTDYSNPEEWKPAPTKPQNRCNSKGETALYLGSTETICVLETHIAPHSKYALGEYIVNEDITVGGFIYITPKESKWKIIVGTAYNAFLIAPKRNDNNNALFEVIDSHFADDDYGNIRLKTIMGKDNLELPFRFGKLFPSENYYDFTNMLTSILKKQNPEGIRYSSCFIPMETVGIECSEHNIVLYEAGLGKVQFNRFEIKENELPATPEGIAKLLLNLSDKDADKH